MTALTTFRDHLEEEYWVKISLCDLYDTHYIYKACILKNYFVPFFVDLCSD